MGLVFNFRRSLIPSQPYARRRQFGVLREQVEESPWEQETTLIVSSDHSWRVRTWKGHSGFTSEKAEVSQGLYEPRPVFMVHSPQQTISAQFAKPFSEVDEYKIISSMLDGEIESPDSLKAFVDHWHSTSDK